MPPLPSVVVVVAHVFEQRLTRLAYVLEQLMVGEVARGLSLFGGASSEVRRCNCSVVV